jgi:hypothetical protein
MLAHIWNALMTTIVILCLITKKWRALIITCFLWALEVFVAYRVVPRRPPTGQRSSQASPYRSEKFPGVPYMGGVNSDGKSDASPIG